jgi:hypothetical protein
MKKVWIISLFALVAAGAAAFLMNGCGSSTPGTVTVIGSTS